MNTKLKKTIVKNQPQPLTPKEKQKLDECLRMDDWHFDTMFSCRCTEISKKILGWEKNYAGKSNPVSVYIYGLEGIYTDTKQHAIANFFIKYEYRVYQRWFIDDAMEIKRFIEKEYLLEKYNKKVTAQKRKVKDQAKLSKVA